MKRWITLLLAIALAAGAYVAAGPYLTVRAIRTAVQQQDAAALSRQVDFPALRASLKAQLGDRLLRAAGIESQASLLGSIGLSLASGLVNGMVETIVTPVGLGALMEGRKVWKRIGDGLERPDLADPASAAPPPPQPLRDAEYRYESLSRFTATVRDEDGNPVVFVLTRDGLRWRLSDILLPL